MLGHWIIHVYKALELALWITFLETIIAGVGINPKGCSSLVEALFRVTGILSLQFML